MKKDKAYLQDMFDAIRDIRTFTKNVNENEFLKDKEKQYAVIRGLEILGEASKNISKELKEKHPDIPWRDIAGMRDKLIHFYFGIKIELVMETALHKLPALSKKLEAILKSDKF